MFGLLKKRSRVRNLDELAGFIEGSAAYMIQRGIFDYSRAAAGPFGTALLSEDAYMAAADESRWKAWPMGLAMLAETVDLALRPAAGTPLTREVGDLTLGVFDRYPVPSMLTPETWAGLRADLVGYLGGIGLHAAKPVRDVPLAYVDRFYRQMPIHQANRGDDIGMVTSQLRASVVRFHDDFAADADLPGLVAALRRAAV
jgi:hypothetical protein